ncbi:hypothetical protein [Nostoc sp. NZL]|uniref:hypothetical protein n=1 Tax=Nostoc sp. NZL TaxID=2650612 RepID=UPI0018C7F245|nr:hypothetical protein [Nostoc sp. NZL]
MSLNTDAYQSFIFQNSYIENRRVKKKPLESPEVLVPDLVSTSYYNLSSVISR